MSLNSEMKFSEIPSVEKQRSTFDRSFSHKTTLNAADIVPLMWSECLPADTIQIDFSHVTRMTTPIAPVMDNAWLDVYAFFVPTRLLWEHWKEFWGENNTTYWEQPVKYRVPKLAFNGNQMTSGVKAGSLMNYLGIPVGYQEQAGRAATISAFPLRGYVKIFNDWFRDENLKQPIQEHMEDGTVYVRSYDASGSTPDSTTYDPSKAYYQVSLGQYCARAAKAHDYFTSALPAPLKGPEVSLFGQDGLFPVQSYWTGNADDGYTPYIADGVGKVRDRVTGYPYHNTADMTTWDIGGETLSSEAYKTLLLHNSTATSLDGVETVFNTTQNPSGTMSEALTIQNLWANLNSASISTISQLRTAFAIQRFYEAQARGGSRYCEFLQNIFSVANQDARLQRSEFLGAKRFPINVDQVLQTSGTGASGQTTPQGNTAAYSCTVNSDDLCTYSTSEHGYIFVMGVIRQEHSYAQGINKEWFRDDWTDYYIPQFAHLSEMPIKKGEIYAQGTDTDDEVFGYQEAWSEYRYKPNMITGKLSPQDANSLALWHYGDYYQALPTLSSEWIDETPNNIARTLAVQNEPQFIMDAYFSMKWTRVMPLYSVPGMLDHM